MRQQGGTFVLRIEDTDEARNRPEWTDGIVSALNWLGLAPDEGPYFQSANEAEHDAAIEMLWAHGALYACGCTREEIDARTRRAAAAGDRTPGYDGHCRDLGLPRGEGRALRFRTPDEGVVRVDDLVRGEVEFPLAGARGLHLCQGQRQGALRAGQRGGRSDHGDLARDPWRGPAPDDAAPDPALGGAERGPRGRSSPLPAYAHLPLLVNEQGKKLSKRRDPVAVEMYREQGYLPEAFCNYLALLGWSPGEEEILAMEAVVERFRLQDVQRSPAFFDVKKLTHFNGVYIRDLTPSEFVAAARPWVDPIAGDWSPGRWRDPDTGAPVTEPPPWPADRFDPATFEAVAAVTQERVTVLGDIPELVDFLFLEGAPEDEDSWRKAVAGDELAPSDPGGGTGGVRDIRVGRGRAPRGDARGRRQRGTQTRQGAGADPGRSHGADPWPAAVRLAGGVGKGGDVAPAGGGAGPARPPA